VIVKDAYYTLKIPASHEIKVKGSRFIGHARSITDRHEAEVFVQSITKKHYDATHNCFGYRVGLGDGSVFRYSDDGEPSGTAGKPILEAIDGRGLTNTVCVVTRYYGGTKLGTGGLARAYGECGARTLDVGGRQRKYRMASVQIVFEYDLTGVVMAQISDFECRVKETNYGSDTEMMLEVRLSRVEAFLYALIDRTAGRVDIVRKDLPDG